MMCVLGVLLALLERQRSGRGQVLDAAMVDGAAYLASFMAVNRSTIWSGARGTNLLDSGAPFYDTYITSDGQYMAVGCLEPPFFARFLGRLGLDADELAAFQAGQMDRELWPRMRLRFAELFRAHSAEHWTRVFAADPDACVTPVAAFFDPSRAHPHAKARGVLPTSEGVAAAPRLLGTPALPFTPHAAAAAREATRAVVVARCRVPATELRAVEEPSALRSAL